MNDALAPADALSSLAALDRARELLAQARNLDDVKKLSDAAEAFEAMQARKAKGTEAQAEAWAFLQECDLRLGQFSAALPKARPGRKPSGNDFRQESVLTKTEELERAKVAPKRASQAERVAALAERDPQEYAARVKRGREAIMAGRRPKPVHAVTSSTSFDSDSYCTPGPWAERIREALGGRIDLDPMSNAHAANVLRPERFYTRAENGLMQSWRASTLYLNPPYSRLLIRSSVDKLLLELDHIEFAIVLVNSSTSSDWFQLLGQHCDGLCLPNERLAFELENGEPVKGNLYDQAFFYFGKKLDRFYKAFSPHGLVFAGPVRGFF